MATRDEVKREITRLMGLFFSESACAEAITDYIMRGPDFGEVAALETRIEELEKGIDGALREVGSIGKLNEDYRYARNAQIILAALLARPKEGE